MSEVTVERDGHVLRIGLNAAEKLNSFGLQMLRELAEAATLLEDDRELWCGLLFAHGASFTSGLRLDEVGPAVAAGAALFPDGSVDPLDLHGRRRTKPLVMGVQGWCLTIGVELLLASDVAVAAENTQLAQMEVQRGIMPFGGATLRFARRCGWGNAMRWMLTGERFDAAEALRIGLVQEVVPADRVVACAAEIAHTIAAQAPLAVQATRRSARTAEVEGEGAALAALMGEARALMSTRDAREGVLSFVERRPARFEGR